MKQVMCTDEKCSIENMPKVNQRGRGSGLNPTGTPYLIPLKSRTSSTSTVHRRRRKSQRGRGMVKKSTSQTGKGRR